MGNYQAAGLRSVVDQGIASLDMALSIHFSSNHYPPLPQALIPAAIEAINAYNEKEDVQNEFVDIGQYGASHRIYGPEAPVLIILDAWNLWAFVNVSEE